MISRVAGRIAWRPKAVLASPMAIAICLTVMTLWAGCAITPRPESASAARPVDRAIEARVPPDARKAEAGQSVKAYLQRVREQLEAFCAVNGCPGATLGFVLPDSRSGSTAAGVTCKGDGRAMRPGDRMLSGSIGKTYVATVLLQLVEEERVKLDTKISHWFGNDEWFAHLPNARDISLRVLMNHTSGIARHIFTAEFQAAVKAEPQRVWRPEELLMYVLDKEPLFPVGQGWSYADTNYVLVGMIIERVTGRTYYQELADRILTPLKLTDTSPSDRPELRGLVCGYTSEDNIMALPVEVARDGRYAINPQLEWTGGGLVSTALDLARWAWLLYGGRVLEDESLRRMLESVPMGEDSDRKYGLAVMIRPSAHGPVYGHAGYMPGYVSVMAYYADHGLAMAVQVNTEVGVGGAALRTLLDEVAGDLLKR